MPSMFACCGSQQLPVDHQICALSPTPFTDLRPCLHPSIVQDLPTLLTNCNGDWTLSSEAACDSPRSVGDALREDEETLPQQFWVTVEKHGNAKWGIDIEWRNRNNLRIVGVKEGIISRWNACNPALRLEPGDLIVEMNGIVSDTEKLVKEISTSRKLTMRVQSKPCLASSFSPCKVPERAEEVVAKKVLPSKAPVVRQFDDFQAISAFAGHKVYDVNFFEDGMMLESLKRYHACCRDSSGLLMTTSSLSAWTKAGELNGAAKVVPAVPLGSEGCGNRSVRTFVFDQMNLLQGGGETAKGRCNLRDVQTGKFVDHSVGQNGFSRHKMFSHTVIHHSSNYNSVLVQVNILDVMTNPDFFMSIIKKYASPEESIVVHVDVYGTVIWDKMVDGATCYEFGLSEFLLCSMFRLLEVRPPSNETTSLRWGSQPAVTLTEAESLLSLIKRVLKQDDALYQQFWTFKMCKRFLEAVASVSEIAWQDQKSSTTTNQFFIEYSQNIDAMRRHGAGAGISDSWLRCCEQLVAEGHSVVVNSFNPESQKILRHLVADPMIVPQLMVNYSSWSQQEVDLLSRYFAK